MNPWPAVFGQALSAGLVLALLASFDQPVFNTLGLVGLLLFCFVTGSYALDYSVRVFRGWRSRRRVVRGDEATREAVGRPRGNAHGGLTTARSSWRRRSDRLVAAEIAWVVAAPLVTALLVRRGDIPDWNLGLWITDLAIFVLFLGLFLLVATTSSFVDWFYIRPRRDGLVWLPPCWNPKDRRWEKVTKTWFRHRLVADSAFALLFPLSGVTIILVLGTEVSPGRWVSRAVGLVFTLTGLALRYAWTRVRTGMLAISGSGMKFRLGETISWRIPDEEMPGNLKLQRVGLFGLSAHFGFGRTKPVPAGTLTEGTGGFVFDVSSKESQILRPAQTRGHDGVPDERLPVASLLRDGVVTRHRIVQYCGLRALGGDCRRLHSECERDLTRT